MDDVIMVVLFYQGTGNEDCEFIVSMVQDRYVTLEVCHHLGNFLGALPTGQITDPAQTEKTSEVAQFAPHVIVSNTSISCTLMWSKCLDQGLTSP